ncbi:hypothetical protein FRB97_003869 [Tulasnella sp. 331]|nr:hypothetical protein FRB97_003869 [Tulasnella sp. 331]KAG8889554.1 hypothetical protein FRB98_003823 [Tulasnella sp. 332]
MSPVLYVFRYAVWPSAALLAVHTLGYGSSDIDIKEVSIPEGANLAPEFISINFEGTLPILTVAGKTLGTDSTTTIQYLINNAPHPAGYASGTSFVERIHGDDVDPNFAFASARNDQELKAKGEGLPGILVRGRQAALERFAKSSPTNLAPFYKSKLQENTFSLAIFSPSPPSYMKNAFLEKSKALWLSIRSFILNDIPAVLPTAGFIGVDTPGEDDFHLAAWLARMTALCGGNPDANGVFALKKELGGPDVPQKVVDYWGLWTELDAWQMVYKEKLH